MAWIRIIRASLTLLVDKHSASHLPLDAFSRHSGDVTRPSPVCNGAWWRARVIGRADDWTEPQRPGAEHRCPGDVRRPRSPRRVGGPAGIAASPQAPKARRRVDVVGAPSPWLVDRHLVRRRVAAVRGRVSTRVCQHGRGRRGYGHLLRWVAVLHSGLILVL